MASLDFDDYDSILSSLHGNRGDQRDQEGGDQYNTAAGQNRYRPGSLFAGAANSANGGSPEDAMNPEVPEGFHPHHFQTFQTGNEGYDQSRYNSISSTSNLGSEVNFNDMNDAVSSLSSSILSPYSSGSSPDDFMLSGGVPANSQDANPNFVPVDPVNDANYDNHYVPMGESMSTSTVTFNSAFDHAGVPGSVGGAQLPNGQTRIKQEPQPTIPEEEMIEPSRRQMAQQKRQSQSQQASSQNSDNQQRRKRNSSATIKSKSENNKPGRKIKSSHNLIEKKYRTNINSKIIELRNCVPSLRILISKSRSNANGGSTTGSADGEEQFDDDYEGNGYSDDERKLDGLKPARKLNKATILSKATEYIHHLESKNKALFRENQKLRELMIATGNATFDGLDGLPSQEPLSGSNPPMSTGPSQFQSDSSYTSSPSFASNNSNLSPTSNQLQGQQDSPRGSFGNKVIVGGMAGMLGASAIDDFTYNNGTGRQGLFAIPVIAFDGTSTSFNSGVGVPLFGLAKLMFCLGVYYYYFFLPFFNGMSKEGAIDIKRQFHDLLTKMVRLFLHPSSCLAIEPENAEYHLLKSVNSSKVVSYTELFKVLALRKNCFLKSMYLKNLGETTGWTGLFDRLGRRYWKRAADVSDHTLKDLDGLLRLDYDEFKISALRGSRDYKTGMASLLLRSVAETQVKKALQDIVSIESLTECIKDCDDADEANEMIIEQKRLQNNCKSLLKSVHTYNDLTSPELQVEVSVLDLLQDPSKEALDKCFEVAQSAGHISNNEQIGLICAVLIYELSLDDTDVDMTLKWIEKLQLPNFTAGFGSGSQLSLFAFASLLSVFNRIPYEALQQNDDDALDDSESIDSIESVDESSLPKPVIPQINFKLLNILANMRIFAGNKAHASELSLDPILRQGLVDGLLSYIQKLNNI